MYISLSLRSYKNGGPLMRSYHVFLDVPFRFFLGVNQLKSIHRARDLYIQYWMGKYIYPL